MANPLSSPSPLAGSTTNIWGSSPTTVLPPKLTPYEQDTLYIRSLPPEHPLRIERFNQIVREIPRGERVSFESITMILDLLDKLDNAPLFLQAHVSNDDLLEYISLRDSFNETTARLLANEITERRLWKFALDCCQKLTVHLSINDLEKICETLMYERIDFISNLPPEKKVIVQFLDRFYRHYSDQKNLSANDVWVVGYQDQAQDIFNAMDNTHRLNYVCRLPLEFFCIDFSKLSQKDIQEMTRVGMIVERPFGFGEGNLITTPRLKQVMSYFFRQEEGPSLRVLDRDQRAHLFFDLNPEVFTAFVKQYFEKKLHLPLDFIFEGKLASRLARSKPDELEIILNNMIILIKEVESFRGKHSPITASVKEAIKEQIMGWKSTLSEESDSLIVINNHPLITTALFDSI